MQLHILNSGQQHEKILGTFYAGSIGEDHVCATILLRANAYIDEL